MRSFQIVAIAGLIAIACQEYEVSDDPEGKGGNNDDTATPSGDDDDGDTDTFTFTFGDDDDDDDTDTDTTTERTEDENVDETIQAAISLVDVLWVVDNSCSMGDDQASLTTHFPTFIDYFENVEGIDYHIGVVSTDMVAPSHQGQLREAAGLKWLDNNSPDQENTFVAMAGMGTGGSGDEAGRAAAHYATQNHANGFNAGFFRASASLAVIIISDEDDSSDQFGVDIPSFVTAFQGFKPDPALVSFSTIVGPTPGGCATADAGTQYETVRTQVGGVFHSICAADWDDVLEDLAASALNNRREFFLAEVPEVDTIRVHVIEENGSDVWFDVNVDFTYDPVRNSITFISYIPGPLAEVYVHYTPDFGAAW